MTAPERNTIRGAASALLLLIALPLPAATVEVQVRDQDGGPIANAWITLQEVTAEGSLNWGARVRAQRVLSDRGGKLTFTGVAPGQYKLHPRSETSRGYVDPETNPFAPSPLVTLSADDEVVRVDLELWRGIPVFARADYQGRISPTVTVRFRELDHGLVFEKRLPDGTEQEQLLLPGRWEAWIPAPASGFLLYDVEVDGHSVDGYRALFEIEPAASPTYLSWYFAAPALLHGKVSFDGERAGAYVAARLIEPGPWITAVAARGGSSYERVGGGLDPNGYYEMVLPDGVWDVRVEGDGVMEVEPPDVQLTLAPDEHVRQDFLARGEPGESRGALRVEVLTPDGDRVRGATIEVWPLDPAGRFDEPVARAESVGYSGTPLRNVPAGDYVVGAAIPGFLEGSAPVNSFDPANKENAKAPPVRVMLRKGATLHVIVRDEAGGRTDGIDFRLERLDDPPQTLVRDDALLEELLSPRAESDATGHAWMRGIWPGRYTLRGTVSGQGAASRFVRLRDGAGLAKDLELQLDEAAEVEVEALLVPAASIRANLTCTDGRPLPGLVSLTAVTSELDPTEYTPDELAREARVRLDRLPVLGPNHDQVHAGPLEEGFYLFGLRPEGYDRWTWLPGSEHPADAVTIHSVSGDPTEMGIVPVDCGPAIRVFPQIESGADLPDFRAVDPRKIVTIRGTVAGDDGEVEVKRVTVDVHRDHVVLRGLPEGEAELTIELKNAYFLPRPALELTVEGTLDRGRVLDVESFVADVGGVLRVHHPEAVAIRIRDAESALRTEAVLRNTAEFRSVAEGQYDVVACSDAECAEVLEEWNGVAVHRLRVTELTRSH